MKRFLLSLMAAGALGADGAEPVELLSASGNSLPGDAVWPGGQTNSGTACSQVWASHLPGVILDAPTQTPVPNLQSLIRSTNMVPKRNLKQEYFLDKQRFADASGLLKPGAYETRPYTMIVRAPGAVDEKMIAGIQTTPGILRTVPGLEFVPRGGSPPPTNTPQGK